MDYRPIQSLLIANRSEIAIRVMRAAAEMNVRTVAIYSKEDRLALHRFKADESYLVGEGKKPLAAYLDIDDILRIARQAGVDAIHPGYGFLSENPEFAQAVIDAGIRWIGPLPEVMRKLGNKVAARNAAIAAGVPVMPATDPLPHDLEACKRLAAGIGYPLMLKASWGGGGRGMRVLESEQDLEGALAAARREALAAFGNDEVYVEKLVRNARHVEVQVLGDTHGNLVHLYERDCTVQRRNQKVVERAPAPYLDAAGRGALCESALRLMRAVGYTHAGTVEFLMDADSGQFYFIEVNPRIQVEHTVTEMVTGIDIVKAQIRITEGGHIGMTENTRDADGRIVVRAAGVPVQQDIALNGHALQCRITTEDPENGFLPDYGRLTAYRSAAGFGVRLDAGTAYGGAVITPYYDSLLVKVTTWAPTAPESMRRMDRALREFRIRGVASNLQFLENVINHPAFRSGDVTTRFIDKTPELLAFAKRQDRATKLLRYLGEVSVNGHPEMSGRALPSLPLPAPVLPAIDTSAALPYGTRDRLRELGAEKFSRWMLEQKPVLLTDTTMRDAHQSLFATRMRSADMLPIAPFYARELSQLFSLECWGGATFDVALRFLKEDPWQRLEQLRERVPNVLFQMLLRGSNAVGYTNYADNVVRFFVRQAASAGVDVFRVFDSLNWVRNMRVAIDAVGESGALCEGAICYTGDLFDPKRSKYDLKYYVGIARELQQAGVHVLGIKDMAGICRPQAAAALVRALKEETGLPVHFHTHDTSGISAASALAAIEAGCDAVDGALDAMSGLTSQPNLSSIAAALAGSERDPGLNLERLHEASMYWEGVRRYYAPFESEIRAGTADVYRHEMPGGQYTNLREQARSLGIEHRWTEVSRAYAEVNQMFGDIVKVTPTSKVVGDLALMMVANDLSAADVCDPGKEIAFPESVVSLFRGELGFPPDGFPAALSRKVLRGEPPAPYRPGDQIAPVDLDAARAAGAAACEQPLDDRQLASYLMYPKQAAEYHAHVRQYSDTSVVPTPAYLYGLQPQEEVAIDIEPGKTLLVSLQGTHPDADEGKIKVQFELNGQSRTTLVEQRSTAQAAAARQGRAVAEPDNPLHVAAPMPGSIVTVAVQPGQRVAAGTTLLALEAMKMETHIAADRDCEIAAVHVKAGDRVAAKDLLVELKD
ncbi:MULTISPECIES: pyruvate carboxylase [Cupriavidus]|uniref:pyruvate carboxylase n=1 Tax=Cupriavidus TaxID=106589 RepID=UPI000E1AA0BC|nr:MULTISPECIES: pyruvate carboxylase [Cupriavidus]MEC3765317.1 pyruvate carboxylase [Cupriavidus sp. SS-3]SOY90989.1 putative Pyruvate carboxylase [Cupriavidus taiwanensis]SOY91649.1 putative Pyruvate carboxylase [Cupriavidus taiwanensis]